MPKCINIPKSKLIDLYIDKKLSTVKIGKLYNCYASTIRDKLLKFNIPVRSYKEGISLRDAYGSKNPNWIDGRTCLKKLIREIKNYVYWKEACLERDNYTCKNCGNTIFEELEVHHCNRQFSDILESFLREYDQFSPIEDKETLIRLATKYKPFWDINNGITLCKDCHNEEHIKIKKSGEK